MQNRLPSLRKILPWNGEGDRSFCPNLKPVFDKNHIYFNTSLATALIRGKYSKFWLPIKRSININPGGPNTGRVLSNSINSWKFEGSCDITSPACVNNPLRPPAPQKTHFLADLFARNKSVEIFLIFLDYFWESREIDRYPNRWKF